VRHTIPFPWHTHSPLPPPRRYSHGVGPPWPLPYPSDRAEQVVLIGSRAGVFPCRRARRRVSSSLHPPCMPVRCHTASSAHHPHHPHHPAIPQDDSIASQNEERGRTIRVRCVLAKAKHAMGPSRQAWLVARGQGLPFQGAVFGACGTGDSGSQAQSRSICEVMDVRGNRNFLADM
jgi:hypothetical protein